MKRTARILSVWIAVFMFLTDYALAQAPLPISPGDNDGAGIVISGCPSFSWSEVEGAISYHVTVFEPDESETLPTQEEMVSIKTPVLEQTIPDRGLSWTPSANRCLPGGAYVWYVASVGMEGSAEWSEGKEFKVDALAGVGVVSEEKPDDEASQESESPTSTAVDGSGVLSLEQVISSTITREQLSNANGDNQESEEPLGQEAVTMGGGWLTNTLLGNMAGNSISEEVDATFIGASAGFKNTTGKKNTFIGRSAGIENTTGYDNTFVGQSAGYSNTEGHYNTFLGVEAGYSNTTGIFNTFIGRSAGKYSQGGYNTFIGYQAGNANTTGSSNTFFGVFAGSSNTTGFSNVFIGRAAGTMNIDGDDNIFIGRATGSANTDGDDNTFVGRYAGFDNTTGNENTFIGMDAGRSSTTASGNTFLGHSAGYENTIGEGNTFVGNWAGYNNTEGHDNTFHGQSAGYSNEAGSQNTLLGRDAGFTNTNGEGNIFIGFKAGYSEVGSNKLYIHNSDTQLPLVYGEFNKRFLIIHGQLQMASAPVLMSDRRLKRDIQPLASSLDKVQALQGVSYQWKTDQYPDWGFADTKQIGLVAQDVEAIIPELVSTDSQGYKAVSYDKLTAVLVEAVKELKADNNKLKAELKDLRMLIEKLNDSSPLDRKEDA